jgi:hypothetical protein
MDWPSWGRLGFRIAFIYFAVSMVSFQGNATIFRIFPVVGDWIGAGLHWPVRFLAEWAGTRVFHLKGLAARWLPSGSGDTELNWIANGWFLLIALGGGLLWTAGAAAAGSPRTEYQTLHAWLRFGLRLTCGMFMMSYGLAKLYPRQMAPISIAILNEPIGASSPMTLLWSLIGMNPWYETICGAAEVAAGALLLIRRTALAGALLSAFVMANVVLYNLFFDVPVKLFALNLLAALLFLVLPDAPALVGFFWKHQPSAPSGVWIPPLPGPRLRLVLRSAEGVFVLGFLVYLPVMAGIDWLKYHQAARVPTPLAGAWKLDTHPAEKGPFLDPEGRPMTDLYIDTAVRAFLRSADGELWRTNVQVDGAERTIRLSRQLGEPATYGWSMPDANHLVLRSVPSRPPAKAAGVTASAAAGLTLTRTPVPDHYPLLDRGFHWVNEWGLER